jgi:hypothetical protein
VGVAPREDDVLSLRPPDAEELLDLRGRRLLTAPDLGLARVELDRELGELERELGDSEARKPGIAPSWP